VFLVRSCLDGAVHPPVFRMNDPLSDWRDCTLEMCCDAGCGRSVHPAIKLVGRTLGDDAP
jgi:hypothetical protein